MTRVILRGAIVLTLLLCTLKIIANGLSDLLVKSNPGIAVWLSGENALARKYHAAFLASSAEPDDQEGRKQIEATLLSAVKANPFEVGVLPALGLLAEDNRRDVAPIMRRAVASNQRDFTAQTWLLDAAVAGGDASAMLRHLSGIFMGQEPSLWAKDMQRYAAIMTSPAARSQFSKWLAQEEKWRLQLLPRIAQSAPETADLIAFMQDFNSVSGRMFPDQSRDYMLRLLREGLIDVAYMHWLKNLPPERLPRLGLLYNSNFEYALTNLPFDWLINASPGFLAEVVTEDRRRILSIEFFGSRIDFRHVSHLLTLPPGPYELSGLVRTQNLENEVGLRWRLSCARADQAELGASERWRGSQNWSPFNFSFTVPTENCPHQLLQLELPRRVALDTIISGGISFSELRMSRRAEAPTERK